MPAVYQLSRRCGKPNCHSIVSATKICPLHPPSARRREIDEHRGSARARGYDSKWERRRNAWLRVHPNCAHHALGMARHPDDGMRRDTRRLEPGKIVDHVRPHRDDRGLFDDDNNLQTLCPLCDGAKKPRENGLAPCPEHAAATKLVQGRATCILCGGDA